MKSWEFRSALHLQATDQPDLHSQKEYRLAVLPSPSAGFPGVHLLEFINISKRMHAYSISHSIQTKMLFFIIEIFQC